MRVRRSIATLTLSAAVTWMLACAGDGTGPSGDTNNGGNTGGGTGTPTFSGSVQPIFTANCAFSGCHAGSAPQQGMDLSAGQAYDHIVGVASNEAPSLLRVEPGQPDASYLVHKIQGTQNTVGGSGVRMPAGGPYLSDAQIQTIRDWISAGAQRN